MGFWFFICFELFAFFVFCWGFFVCLFVLVWFGFWFFCLFGLGCFFGFCFVWFGLVWVVFFLGLVLFCFVLVFGYFALVCFVLRQGLNVVWLTWNSVCRLGWSLKSQRFTSLC